MNYKNNTICISIKHKFNNLGIRVKCVGML